MAMLVADMLCHLYLLLYHYRKGSEDFLRVWKLFQPPFPRFALVEDACCPYCYINHAIYRNHATFKKPPALPNLNLANTSTIHMAQDTCQSSMMQNLMHLEQLIFLDHLLSTIKFFNQQ